MGQGLSGAGVLVGQVLCHPFPNQTLPAHPGSAHPLAVRAALSFTPSPQSVLPRTGFYYLRCRARQNHNGGEVGRLSQSTPCALPVQFCPGLREFAVPWQPAMAPLTRDLRPDRALRSPTRADAQNRLLPATSRGGGLAGRCYRRL